MKLLATLMVVALACATVSSAMPVTQENAQKPLSLTRMMGLTRIGDQNGGTNCAVCTIVVGLVDELSILHNQSVATVMSDVCNWLPSAVRAPCHDVVSKYGPTIVKFVADHLPPDEICLKMSVCKSATCHLYPSSTLAGRQQAVKERIDLGYNGEFSVLGTPWDWIKKEIDRVFNTHEPLVDLDNDLYSTEKTLRGSSWRGKDCNDFDKNAYPGRATDDSATVDSNCNGITGTDPATGKSYEELFCAGTNSMSTVILGDSAAAHFHIPPEYLTPALMNSSTYDELLFVLENEFDWPQQSSTTAFLTQADRWDQGPISSIYEQMVRLNRCNHRDYQNIAVNGARSGSMNNTIVRSLARNPAQDKPMLVFYALIGNDVCDGHPDYYNHMTTPQQFYANVRDALDYLDTVAPPNSHVVFTGLPDGRLLYNALHNRTHPIGAGVTYADVYSFLNCLEISPCYVWMNTNETIRDAGTARAVELNQVYKDMIQNTTYKNFDMHYYDMPIAEAIKEWEAKGGHVWDLIEPVDGFHPNQLAMALTANMTWHNLISDHPDWFVENPNNAKIQQIFGDQGGY